MKDQNLLYASGGRSGSPDAPAYYGEESLSALSEGDVVSDNLLYASIVRRGGILYEGIDPKIGEITWWWDFVQNGQSPRAYVNSTMVCGGHSTTHIAGYRVSVGVGKSIRIVMRMARGTETGNWYPGHPCIHRIWKSNGDYSPEGYAKQKDYLKAQRGGSEGGGATFNISISSKGKVKFS